MADQQPPRPPSPRIAVVGLGYVGLPLALSFVDGGCSVTGLDIDPIKPNTIAGRKSYLNYVPDAAVASAVARGFVATTDFAAAHDADAVIICVPTPLDAHHQPDLSFVTGSLESLLPHLRPGQLVALESTTWPGTTEEVLRPRLESAGFTIGLDLFLAYSPERQDPGNSEFGTRNIPKLVGGSTAACLQKACSVYRYAVDRVVPVSSTRVAEMAKLLENIHRSVNIGLVNEMKIVADRMGVDIHEVIDAAATKPFGFVAYRPGPGLGGHCIPIDPFYLTWKAREVGVHTRFIELAGEINHAMPEWVIQKLLLALNDRGKALRGSRVLVLGLAYKKNVDDLRESPAVEILHRLQDLGAEVAYSDPHVPVFPQIRRGWLNLSSVPLDAETVSIYDAVMLITAHDAFDFAQIARHAQLLIDTRGVIPVGPNVVRA